MLVIRMRRVGGKKRPAFRLVLMEARTARDGRAHEVLGHYNPTTQPETLTVNRERLQHWLQQGAQPSDTVRTLLARHQDVAAAAETEAPAPALPLGEASAGSAEQEAAGS